MHSLSAFVFSAVADGDDADFLFFNLLHRRERKNLCSDGWSMDSSFCIFFTWAKFEFLQFGYRHVKKMASVQRARVAGGDLKMQRILKRLTEPAGESNPFGSGFPIGASSTLLAHDFPLESLVCYTFGDRWCWKGGVALQNTPFPVAAGQADFGTVYAEMQDLSV